MIFLPFFIQWGQKQWNSRPCLDQVPYDAGAGPGPLGFAGEAYSFVGDSALGFDENSASNSFREEKPTIEYS